MQFLERDTFLDTLAGYADEAAAGASRVVFVAGEAGVGKSTLVELFRQQRPDARWLVGRSDGSFTPEPLGPLFDIAEQVGGSLATACAEGADRDRLFRLLLDEIRPPAPPTVLVIEDAHWADEATLDLVRFLARRMRDSAVMLLVTFRDEALDAQHQLRLTLGDLGAERSVRRMTVPPLSPAAVERLAAGTAYRAPELYALTGGNPFFVTEVLGAGAATLPVSARDAVLARVARMSTPARVVLDAAAVVGGVVDPGILAGVCGDLAGLDECLDNGALVADSDGVRFRHELSRLAVAEAITVHRRRDLHARALAVLRERPGVDLAQLAHHADGAADAAAVLEFAPLAAERAAGLGAHREAAQQYDRALRFAAGRPDAERARLTDGLASELFYIEHWAEAIAQRRRAADLWREAGDMLRYGDSLRYLGRAMMRMLSADGDKVVEQSVQVLEGLPPSRELAAAYSVRAGVLMYSDPPRSMELAQRARTLLEQLGIDDPAIVSDSLNTESCVVFGAGKDGTAMLEESLEVALNGGCEEQASRAYSNLVVNMANTYRLSEAIRFAELGLEFCEDRDIDVYANCIRGAYVAVLERCGRWDEAAEIAAERVDGPGLSPYNRLSLLRALAVIRVRRGERGVEDIVAELESLLEGSGRPEYDAEVAEALVELAWIRGDHALARRLAEEVVQRPDMPAEYLGSMAPWLRRVGGSAPTEVIDDVRRRQLTEPWQDVAAMWAGLGLPYEHALALFDSGEEEPMRQAVAILDGLGALGTIATVQSEMRRRGFKAIPRGSRASTRSDSLGLTARQRQVFELVAQGLTNADIGARLFLSERTVDHHVSAVLAKLGVESRREAARIAADSGVLESAG